MQVGMDVLNFSWCIRKPVDVESNILEVLLEGDPSVKVSCSLEDLLMISSSNFTANIKSVLHMRFKVFQFWRLIIQKLLKIWEQNTFNKKIRANERFSNFVGRDFPSEIGLISFSEVKQKEIAVTVLFFT